MQLASPLLVSVYDPGAHSVSVLATTTTFADLTESFLGQRGPVFCQEAEVRLLSAQLVVPDVPVALRTWIQGEKHLSTWRGEADPKCKEFWVYVPCVTFPAK